MVVGLGDYCSEVLREHGCPSVSVAVAEKGEVVLAEAYGWADVAAGRAATPDTAYTLASVTKPITAVAVCLAADDGLLDLDGPVAGEYRWPGPAPTVRQLLRHRGGLAAHYDFRYGPGERRIDADRYATLFREPGSGFEYSNLGYRILGLTLEAATGRPLAEFVRERVFAPLGLVHCGLGPTFPGAAPTASRYTADGRAYPAYDSSHPGASLGWAPAGELAVFALSYERLLRPETAAAVREALPVHDHLGYGLGWCVSRTSDPVVQSHGGGMGGVAAMLVAVPERDLSVAVLTNSTGKAARDAVVGRVLGALVPGFTPESISPAVPEASHPLDLPAGTWAGTIATPERDVPVGLRVLTGGRAELELDGESKVSTADASAEWDLRAVFPLQLPTADARINSPLLGLRLRYDSGRLTGLAQAYKDGDRDGLLGNLLSHGCRLKPC
ncbi:serine hydrolase domain-containing protein [Streptomyces sp. NPDC006012]|uniref:serine hydrolase domain-containing protein n=1 Tax=Streptomyces sp. NPDC006012 TaxID=3364739 RepID=UPI0036837F2C